MSTRYVWEKRNINFPSPTYETVQMVYSSGGYLTTIAASAIEPYITSNGGDVSFRVKPGALSKEFDGAMTVPCSEYPHVIISRNGSHKLAYATSGYWFRDDNSYNDQFRLRWTNSSMTNYGSFKASYGINKSDCTAGTVIGKVSSASIGAYSTVSGGSISGDYWYIYLGSDSIDPTAISTSTVPHAGENVTVSITPGSSNVYGGTVKYLYQYCMNGGSWTNISTTTATSVSFTVPANAKTIQFRARAQDDMGFVSSDYVTSTSTAVERLNAWIGVSGKARKGVELYVGVNGKARKVTAAYIGVNGKARRFL